MEILHFILIFIAGVVCGVINIIAGGGSLITLPLLIGLGLPADMANGTNRIGILLQDIGATWRFYKQKRIPLKESVSLAIPTWIGSVIGTLFAVNLSKEVMNWVILIVLFLMFCLLIGGGKRILMNSSEKPYKMTVLNFIIFLVIGFYGGFIQVGMTYLILAALILHVGNGLIKADVVKIVLNLVIIPVALIIFFLHGLINWEYGLILGAGSVIGGVIGAKFAIKWNVKIVKYIMLGILIISFFYMLFFQILR